MIDSFRKWYRGLPDKKRYFEFLSALLTIPVLVTVIILNLDSLRKKNEPKEVPTAKETVKIVTVQPEKGSPTPTIGAQCKEEVGPVEISSPKEDEKVTTNPVCFSVEYKDDDYCSVTWSYRIDNSEWSDYTDKSVCIYNLGKGDHKFELRVKSNYADEQVELVRNFTYEGKEVTPTPTASQ